MELRQTVREHPVLAILRNVPTERLIAQMEAVVAGGVRFFEVAMNTPNAPEQIALLRRRFEGRGIVGAGTVITPERARIAVEAGAQFLVSPSADEPVLRWCREKGIPLLPGVMTPSDVSLCLRYGFDTMKLFPAGDLPETYVKSLKGPFDGTEYVAVGGVTVQNAVAMFRRGCIGVGIGGDLVPRNLAEAGDWDAVTRRVRSLLQEISTVK